MITKKYKAGDINIIAGKGGGDPLTRVDTLPEPSEETYNENKIYDQNNNLSYIGREEPVEYSEETYFNAGSISFESGMVLANDSIYSFRSNLTIINLKTKDVQSHPLPTNSYAGADFRYGYAYCPEKNAIYIIGKTKIYKLDLTSGVPSEAIEVASLPETFYYAEAVYCNKHIYFASSNYKLYDFNPENNEITVAVSGSGSSPYARMQMCSDDKNVYYITYNYQYGIVKYDTTTKTSTKIVNYLYNTSGTPFLTGMCYYKNSLYVFGGFYFGSGNQDFTSIFKVDLTNKKLEKVHKYTKGSDQQAAFAWVYDNKILFHHDSSSYRNEISQFNTTGKPVYKSIPVGGGGAEYEWTKIFDNIASPITTSKVFTSSNVLTWYIVHGDYFTKSLNISLPAGISPLGNEYNEILGFRDFSSDSKKIIIKECTNTTLSVDVRSDNIYYVYAFRKK